MPKSNKSNGGIPIQGSPSSKSKPLIDPEIENSLEAYRKERLNFSFKLFDRECDKYNCGGTRNEWFIGLLEKMKNISDLELVDFLDSRRQKNMYIHTNDFSKEEHHCNYSQELKEQLKENPFFQIGLTKASGRIHGFLIENTFFILWLDPHHQLHAMERHGGEITYEPVLTEIEFVYEELKEAHSTIEEKDEEIKKTQADYYDLLEQYYTLLED